MIPNSEMFRLSTFEIIGFFILRKCTKKEETIPAECDEQKNK